LFFVRVANKGVRLDAASRKATAGLEVALFSGGCRWLVRRAAARGLKARHFTVDSSQPTARAKGDGKKVIAPTELLAPGGEPARILRGAQDDSDLNRGSEYGGET